MINDPGQLWSPGGVRSLSKQHALYGQGENYWRGPVWLPMNFMALSNLFKVYAKAPGPSQVAAGETYARLRGAIVDNMLKVRWRLGNLSNERGCAADSVAWLFRSTNGPGSCGSSITRRRARASAATPSRAGARCMRSSWPSTTKPRAGSTAPGQDDLHAFG